MPPEEVWQAFFNPAETLRALGLRSGMAEVVDFGCGYGTFTIPAAQHIDGIVHAFDIEPDLVARTRDNAKRHRLENIRFYKCDFVAGGTGLPAATVDYVMLYNILHAEAPGQLLAEAFRILRDGGLLGIMHWNVDPETPRGPPMEIRPTPEQCATWAEDAGFMITKRQIDLPPYHYGILAVKK